MAYETKLDIGWSGVQFSITPESIIYDDTEMMCADVREFGYWSTVTEVQGIKTLTDHNFCFVDSSGDTVEFSFFEPPILNGEVKEKHRHIVQEIWLCFGNRLKAELIQQLARRQTVTLCKLPIDSRGVLIRHNPLLGRKIEVHVPWEELKYKLENGTITLRSTTEMKAGIIIQIDQLGGQLLWALLDSITHDPDTLRIIKGMKRL